MTQLPNELQFHVMSFLTDVELCKQLRGVNKDMRDKVMDELRHREMNNAGDRASALRKVIEYYQYGGHLEEDEMFRMDGLFLSVAERQALDEGRG